MKSRKIIGLLLGVMTVLSGVSLTPVSAAAPDYTILGDINADGSFGVADLVRMQRYLNGCYSLNGQGFRNADMDQDGCTDIFDLAYMKRTLPGWTLNYTKDIDIVHAEGQIPSAVIAGVEELEAYLTVIAENEQDSYRQKYDEAFFQENILCLCMISQGAGEGIFYEITDFEMHDGTLEIHYTDRFEPYMSYPSVETDLLAQVVIPKELFKAQDVEWTLQMKEQAFTPTVKCSTIQTAKSIAWSEGMSSKGARAIRSVSELEKWAADRFGGNVVSALKEQYDAAYFEENVLLTDLYAQNFYDDYVTHVSDVQKTPDGTIAVTYDREYINGFAHRALCITRITVPAEQYSDEPITAVFSWEHAVSGSYSSSDLYVLSDNYDGSLTKKGKWATTAEEFEACFSGWMMDENITELKKQFADVSFEDKAAYLFVDEDVSWAVRDCMRITDDQEQLIVTRSISRPSGCITSLFLNILWVDKTYAGTSVTLRDFNNSDDRLGSEGDFYFYHNPGNAGNGLNYALVVNRYTFDGKNGADFLWGSAGVGLSEYGSFREVGTISLPIDASPFSEVYTQSADEDGNIVFTGEQFRMTWRSDCVLIEYKYGDAWESTMVPYIAYDWD